MIGQTPPLRLAVYLAHYPAPGGTTTAVRGFTQALGSLGHDVEVLCQGPEHRRWKEGSVTVRSFARPHWRLPFLVHPQLLAHLARRRRFDLLLLNGMFHTDLPALAIAARRSGTPYVVAPHDPYHPAVFQQRRVRKEAYWQLVEKWVLRGATGIQLLAERHGTHLHRRGVVRPFVVAPNGVDAPAALPGPRLRNRRPGIVVGALGRIDVWHKGLDLLLAAVAQARAGGVDLNVVIQGRDQGDQALLRQLARTLRIERHVTFPGPARDAMEAIANWDILAVASRYEGFGLTAVEAMVAGTPVLCSDEAGVAEHVERARCGLVVRPTADGLATGLRDLVARRAEWPVMGSQGQAYARRELRWEAIAATTAAAYSRIAGRDV